MTPALILDLVAEFAKPSGRFAEAVETSANLVIPRVGRAGEGEVQRFVEHPLVVLQQGRRPFAEFVQVGIEARVDQVLAQPPVAGDQLAADLPDRAVHVTGQAAGANHLVCAWLQGE